MLYIELMKNNIAKFRYILIKIIFEFQTFHQNHVSIELHKQRNLVFKNKKHRKITCGEDIQSKIIQDKLKKAVLSELLGQNL